MGCRQLIKFPVIFRDGQLQRCTTDIMVDCNEIKILGEKTEKAWDAVNEKFMCVTGFFISYKGIEYGSIDVNESDFFNLCQANCPEQDFRLFEDLFDFEFE